MKNLSKALALFVVVAMMLTSVVSVAAFTDVADDTLYASEIDVIAALGLIQGYEDGSFQPEGSITRAEFATIVVRMLGQESQAAGSASATKFADVPADHWAAGYVNIANSLGIINGYGDGNFGPEDPVLYEQAVKMLVCAMGYGKEIDAAGYPVAYLTAASSIGITKGANGENGVAANRGLVAKLVYNSLDKPLMKTQGYGIYAQSVVCDGSNDTVKATILDEYLDIVKLSVNVIESTATSTTTNKAEKVKVEILNNYKSRYGEANDEDTFKKDKNMWILAGDTNASEYVGVRSVIYVAYEDGYVDDAEIVYIAADTSVAGEIIDSIQYEDTTAKTGYSLVEYRETPSDRVTQSFTFDDDSDIYVNGIKLADGTKIKTALTGFYGTAEFTLNDTESEYDYDTAFITNYNTIVVDEVNTKTSRIATKNATSLAYANSENTIKATLYAADGSEMNWEDLKEWDVVSYTTTKGLKEAKTTVIVGYVIDGVVSGTVNGITGAGEYVIGDTEYDLAASIDSKPALGDEGDFYTDIMGNIVYFNAIQTAKTNYAYVKKAQVISDFDDALQLRMFAYDESIATYNLYSTVRYNGKSIKAEDLATKTYEDALTGAFIVFKTNDNAEITAIDFPEKWTADSRESDFTVYGEEKALTSFTEASAGIDTTMSRVYVTEATKIFVIGAKESEYEILGLASLADEDEFKNVTFYNVNDDLEVGAILVKGGYEQKGAKTSPISVATGSGSAQDPDGYQVTTLKAFSDLAETTYVSDSNYTVDAPYVGSIYLPKLTSAGAVKDLTEIVMTNEDNFDVVAGDDFESSKSATGANRVDLLLGTINEVNGKIVNVTVGGEDKEIVVPSTATVYVVDSRVSAKNRVSEGDIGYLDWDDEEKVWTDGSSKTIADGKYVMFARELNGKIVDVVLYLGYTLK